MQQGTAVLKYCRMLHGSGRTVRNSGSGTNACVLFVFMLLLCHSDMLMWSNILPDDGTGRASGLVALFFCGREKPLIVSTHQPVQQTFVSHRVHRLQRVSYLRLEVASGVQFRRNTGMMPPTVTPNHSTGHARRSGCVDWLANQVINSNRPCLCIDWLQKSQRF